jgi:hypothetical protein
MKINYALVGSTDNPLYLDFLLVDENFLNEIVYPLCKSDTFIHDEFMSVESWKKPFPNKRNDKEFVGDVFYEKNVRHPDYYKFIP